MELPGWRQAAHCELLLAVPTCCHFSHNAASTSQGCEVVTADCLRCWEMLDVQYSPIKQASVLFNRVFVELNPQTSTQMRTLPRSSSSSREYTSVPDTRKYICFPASPVVINSCRNCQGFFTPKISCWSREPVLRDHQGLLCHSIAWSKHMENIWQTYMENILENMGKYGKHMGKNGKMLTSQVLNVGCGMASCPETQRWWHGTCWSPLWGLRQVNKVKFETLCCTWLAMMKMMKCRMRCYKSFGSPMANNCDKRWKRDVFPALVRRSRLRVQTSAHLLAFSFPCLSRTGWNCYIHIYSWDLPTLLCGGWRSGSAEALGSGNVANQQQVSRSRRLLQTSIKSLNSVDVPFLDRMLQTQRQELKDVYFTFVNTSARLLPERQVMIKITHLHASSTNDLLCR